IMYQMFNATYASFFQEMFPTESRVTGFALSQNIALFITGLMPSLFAVIAPPSSNHVPLIIGVVTLVLCVASSAAAMFSKETARQDIA
ncbi:MAG: MFS transporter, partial [Candidatus Microbacterium stercoravium]